MVVFHRAFHRGVDRVCTDVAVVDSVVEATHHPINVIDVAELFIDQIIGLAEEQGDSRITEGRRRADVRIEALTIFNSNARAGEILPFR